MTQRIKLDQESYCERASIVHSNLFNYDKTVFTGILNNVIVGCPTHGEFEIQAGRHLYVKRGCPKCSNKYRPSTEEFIERSNVVHKNKYSYDNTVYINNKTKVTVTCPDHGDFSVSPLKHSTNCSATGCPKCADVTKGSYSKKDTKWFIEKATDVHGTKYDYSRVDYQRYHSKVEIVCPDHGAFLQTAGSHIHNKNGCPKCYEMQDVEGGYGIKRFEKHPEIKHLSGILYVIECTSNEEDFLKIGITRNALSQRFGGEARLPYEYREVLCKSGSIYDMFLLEQQLKQHFKQFKYRPHTKFCGHTECLTVDALPLLLEALNQEQ